MRSALVEVRRRVRLWWAVQCDIQALTQDHDRDARAHAAAAVHLNPGPHALVAMFRPSAAPRRRDGIQSAACPDHPRTPGRGEQ
jgi:hypothetical protein